MPAPVPAVAPEAKFLPEGLIYLRQGILPPGPRKVPRRASRLGNSGNLWRAEDVEPDPALTIDSANRSEQQFR